MSAIAARFAGTFGAFRLDAAFEIPARGITGLFGPSGCGKSTLLRCLAGLTRLPGGMLRVGPETWQDETRFVPPWRRAAGYVFQDSRLFAHLSVRENLRFGLRRSKGGAVREEDVVEFLSLAPLLARHPAALSGGERQRVAMGRALLAQPRLLLLDEPLAALDREAAGEILPRLRGLSARFDLPALMVSHQIEEIERVAGHLLYMQGGRIRAGGSLEDLLTDFSLPFAARSGAAAVLALEVTGYDEAYGLSLCGAPPLRLLLPGRLGPAGTVLRLRVPAGDVSIALSPPADSSILNILPARILAAEAAEAADGPHVLLRLGLGEARLLARITRKSFETLALAPGREVFAQVKAEALAGAQ